MYHENYTTPDRFRTHKASFLPQRQKGIVATNK